MMILGGGFYFYHIYGSAEGNKEHAFPTDWEMLLAMVSFVAIIGGLVGAVALMALALIGRPKDRDR